MDFDFDIALLVGLNGLIDGTMLARMYATLLRSCLLHAEQLN